MRIQNSTRLMCSAAAGLTAVTMLAHGAAAQQLPAWPDAKVRATTPAATPSAKPAQPATQPTQSQTKPQAATAERPADLVAHDPEPSVPKKDGQWPKLPEPAPTAQTPVPADVWSEAEITAAQNACVALLKGMDVVAVGAPPMKEGECGTPAPIELVSVGKSPQVTFSPPVVVTCDMAAALHKWVTGDLQVLAKKHLGSPLIRIDTMSSYSCRHAYGRAKNKLSEHGKANAIDIRAFMTAKADAADVLANWGPTQRDIQAQIAAAKAAAAKAEALAKAQKAAPGAPAVANAPATPAPAGQAAPTLAHSPTQPPAAAAIADTGIKRPSISIGVPGSGIEIPSTANSAIGLSTGLPSPQRLGGPKPADQVAKPADQKALRGTSTTDVHESRLQFLHGAHTSACKIFGTVLGPEANNAHRNHFHVDMAKRNQASFCE